MKSRLCFSLAEKKRKQSKSTRQLKIQKIECKNNSPNCLHRYFYPYYLDRTHTGTLTIAGE
ncbi:hypothetical protein M5D96_001012 [Drosophila gunungcola]|uniref:Uncharacterized protein n=1 Tax=Drosophila gunungcola TaxID=103775 RepID=A0A9P9YXD4_9MUSC|nr:hypothetical protein M5D96_001012 [Drosophila gunungcola]